MAFDANSLSFGGMQVPSDIGVYNIQVTSTTNVLHRKGHTVVYGTWYELFNLDPVALPVVFRVTVFAVPLRPGEVSATNKDCPYAETPDVVRDALMAMGDVVPSTVMFDLGSGDGRIMIAAAARGATAVGIDFRGDLNEHARHTSEERQLSHLTSFRSEDFFTADLSAATLVYFYLIPTVVEELAPVLLSFFATIVYMKNAFLNNHRLSEQLMTIYFCSIIPGKWNG